LTDLLRPETFEFFARFLLAGFIALSVRSRFVAGQRPKPSEVLFDAAILSLVNQIVYVFLSTVLIWLTGKMFEEWSMWLQTLLTGKPGFFVEVLVLPAILGWFLASALTHEWLGGVFRRIALPNTHPTERAYDYAFTQLNESCFVILTYQDGTRIYGYFGANSLAATDENRSDIFLERLYSVEDKQEWHETEPSRSAWVSLAALRSIEFLRSKETNTNG